MSKSKIIIVFDGIPFVDTSISIKNTLSSVNLYEKFVLLRNNKYETPTLTGAVTTVSSVAYSYYNALKLDYGNSGLYTISYAYNQVTIEAVQDGVVFIEFDNTTNGAVRTIITNEPAAPTLTIDSITFSEADTNPCENVKVNVTTNELATDIIRPIEVSGNTDNPFSFDWIRTGRGGSVSIECSNINGTAQQLVSLPAILSAENTYLDVINTPSGSTITITHYSTYLLELQYSLDNVNWRTENVFTGIVEGDYTLYVKDQLGCSITKSFEINIFTPDISVKSAFSYLSDSMSIRMKRNQVWDNIDIYKTEVNTLSCEEDVDIPYQYKQLFQTSDVITTQFLSNYGNLFANVIKSDGTKDALVIDKKISFLDIKDRRDATIYVDSEGRTGLYYTTGKTYDYDTYTEVGEYALNGRLPNYGGVGNYVELNGLGWFKIIDIVSDSNRNADVLILDYNYTGLETVIIVGANYNQKNYNVYEFTVDMAEYLNQEIQVEILQSDDVFDDYNYLSEILDVREYHKAMELIWYNNTDTFVYYSTGIKNKARVVPTSFKKGNDSSVDIHKTTSTSIMVESSNYKTKELFIEEITTAINQQLIQASLHKEFYCNRVQYVCNSNPETENDGLNNLYSLTINLNKTGDVFNSEWSGSTVQGIAELVGLIKNEGNYLKLQ